MRLIISMGKGSTNDEIMDYFNLDLTLSLHSLLSASAADRFPSLLLNTFFRNSLLLFHPLRTNSKTIVFSPAMGATLSMLPILILSRTIISPRLIDYKGYNHMHLNGFVDVISKASLMSSYSPDSSRMSVKRSTPCWIISHPTIRKNIL